jgi:hypothetical protein
MAKQSCSARKAGGRFRSHNRRSQSMDLIQQLEKEEIERIGKTRARVRSLAIP